MKKRLTSLFLTLSMLTAPWLSGQTLLQWTFDDPDGTEISAASNTGTVGDWTFDTGLDDRSQITGGVLDIRGLDATALLYPDVFAASASGTAVTNSQLELSFDIPAIDLTGGDGGGANVTVDFFTGGSDPVTDPSTLVGGMRIRKNGGELKATLNNDIGIEVALTSGGASNTNGISVTMYIDLDTDSFIASITGGAGFTGAILGPVPFDGGTTASQITSLRVRATALAATDWGPTDYFQIDNLTLSVGGATQIITATLEISTDGQTWEAASPGDYNVSESEPRLFRAHVEPTP